MSDSMCFVCEACHVKADVALHRPPNVYCFNNPCELSRKPQKGLRLYTVICELRDAKTYPFAETPEVLVEKAEKNPKLRVAIMDIYLGRKNEASSMHP